MWGEVCFLITQYIIKYSTSYFAYWLHQRVYFIESRTGSLKAIHICHSLELYSMHIEYYRCTFSWTMKQLDRS